jgi:SAM-dependent methyltransferase
MVAVAAVAVWWRRHPSACPHSQRFWVEAPHPLITARACTKCWSPQATSACWKWGRKRLPHAVGRGEAASRRRLEILDLQREMRVHTTGRARRRGIDNVSASQADVRSLPYGDDCFDGAFVVATLGEVPDQNAALSELARVIRPGGRLVVGELFGDPHWVRFGALRQRADRAGFDFERRIGSTLGYFIRFRPR